MTLRLFRTFAVFVFSPLLLATSALAQTPAATPESPYGGTTVEEIIARVNDQIITRSDYNRAMTELESEARQKGASPQEIFTARRDLLRNLIDQQLWLSKGKELGITGETELVNRLNEIRKQNHLDSLEDLEKAAKDQGISYEDFKASIRNSIITQLVMREEVGRKIQFTSGEAERYFEQHKQEYAQPESVNLSEILISTSAPASSTTEKGAAPADDAEKVAAAKAKAEELETKLRAGGDFGQLARSFSDGPTAAQGGELGQFRRGALAKVLEDKTFVLQAGEFTEPIRTRQGFVILKVTKHVTGGIPQYKDVEPQVEENFYMARMEPAIRSYLTTMREQAFIDIKPGFSDTGASPRQTKPIYSAYTPPKPKKKQKAERVRFRESTRTFRQKQKPVETAEANAAPQEKALKKKNKKQARNAEQATLNPGKKEKIRYGRAPSKTLPAGPESKTEDLGAEPSTANAGQEPAFSPEAEETPAKKTKTRMRDRVQQAKKHKAKKSKEGLQAATPDVPDAEEIADRQTQSQPLGLTGNVSQKKANKATMGRKTRITDRNKNEKKEQTSGDVPLGYAPQPSAPAPATQP